jgi:hypothetical protein
MRLDISIVVSSLSRFMPNFRDDHWHALKRVIHYLRGTMSYAIHYTRSLGYKRTIMIQAGDGDEMYVISGYAF